MPKPRARPSLRRPRKRKPADESPAAEAKEAEAKEEKPEAKEEKPEADSKAEEPEAKDKAKEAAPEVPCGSGGRGGGSRTGGRQAGQGLTSSRLPRINRRYLDDKDDLRSEQWLRLPQRSSRSCAKPPAPA